MTGYDRIALALSPQGSNGENIYIRIYIYVYIYMYIYIENMSYVFFKQEGVYLQLKLDVAFGVVLRGWRKDCVGLA